MSFRQTSPFGQRMKSRWACLFCVRTSFLQALHLSGANMQERRAPTDVLEHFSTPVGGLNIVVHDLVVVLSSDDRCTSCRVGRFQQGEHSTMTSSLHGPPLRDKGDGFKHDSCMINASDHSCYDCGGVFSCVPLHFQLRGISNHLTELSTHVDHWAERFASRTRSAHPGSPCQ